MRLGSELTLGGRSLVDLAICHLVPAIAIAVVAAARVLCRGRGRGLHGRIVYARDNVREEEFRDRVKVLGLCEGGKLASAAARTWLGDGKAFTLTQVSSVKEAEWR